MQDEEEVCKNEIFNEVRGQRPEEDKNVDSNNIYLNDVIVDNNKAIVQRYTVRSGGYILKINSYGVDVITFCYVIFGGGIEKDI